MYRGVWVEGAQQAVAPAIIELGLVGGAMLPHLSGGIYINRKCNMFFLKYTITNMPWCLDTLIIVRSKYLKHKSMTKSSFDLTLPSSISSLHLSRCRAKATTYFRNMSVDKAKYDASHLTGALHNVLLVFHRDLASLGHEMSAAHFLLFYLILTLM